VDSNNTQLNYSGPTTTAESKKDGRLKVDVSGRKKMLKKILKKYHG